MKVKVFTDARCLYSEHSGVSEIACARGLCKSHNEIITFEGKAEAGMGATCRQDTFLLPGWRVELSGEPEPASVAEISCPKCGAVFKEASKCK